jgi:hypothetical protein
MNGLIGQLRWRDFGYFPAQGDDGLNEEKTSKSRFENPFIPFFGRDDLC